MPERSEGDPATEAPNGSEQAGDAPVATRYSFTTFSRDSWNHFRPAAARLIAIFCVVHVVAAVLPYLVVFDVPDAVGYPLVFLFRVVIPVVLGTLAIAVASVLLSNEEADPSTTAGPRPIRERLRGRWQEVAILGLVASVMGTLAVLFFGAYGFLILHLFYGPPVAIQALTVERLPYRDALQRARSLLRGNWRTILYLLNAALAVGAASLLILDLVVRLLDGGSDAMVRPVLGVTQGLVLGALTAFMAGAQVAIFLHLRAQHPEPTGASDEREALTPEGAPSQD